MKNNYYEIFLNANIDLAETLVIKSSYSAQKINRFLQITAPGTHDPEDPRTWKYYLNLAGEYHQTDTRMMVVSLDTLELIEFNKPNLRLHRATSRAYQYGSRYYNELLAKYPNQESLILGILHPCDLDTAISADDYSILSYPSYLVEPHERTLVPRLNKWISTYVGRWNNIQYRISDDLYETSFLGILSMNLVLGLLSLRMDSIKTNEVHSYFVREYLASHNRLDRAMDTLTRDQSLYFYRNIKYIQRHAGKDDTFRWLTEHLLTERWIPLASYKMTHLVDEITDKLEPEVVFKRINETSLGLADSIDMITTDQLLLKEDRIAKRNPETREHEAQDIRKQFTHSLSNRVRTKVLESFMYDYTDASPYTLSDILTNHWLYLSTTGIYGSYITIENPTTGIHISLKAKDAFTLSFYLTMRSLGFELDRVPTLTASRVQINPTVLATDLMQVSDYRVFDIDFANDLLKHQPTMIPIISTEAFHEKCIEIFRANQYQRMVRGNQESFVRRGLVHGMMSRIYGVYRCQLDPDPTKTFADWFEDRSLDISDFPEADDFKIAQLIINQTTGQDLSTVQSPASIQRAMIGMLTDLSSYSIQFLRYINHDHIRVTEWPVIRTGDVNSSTSGQYGVYPTTICPMDIRATLSTRLRYLINQGSQLKVNVSICGSFRLELPNLVHPEPLTRHDRYLLSVTTVRPQMSTVKKEQSQGMVPVPGLETYLSLTNEQRKQIPDFYT